VLALLTITRGKIRMLMVVCTILMTLGTGLMSLARLDNLGPVIVILIIAGIGIGGILVPASIITTIVCPDDLIATVSALTLSIRVLGGSIGYAVYYNVFYNKFVPLAVEHIGGKFLAKPVCQLKLMRMISRSCC
jgi:MFS-type transporter involved in bile tolerance (Atg22 family)